MIRPMAAGLAALLFAVSGPFAQSNEWPAVLNPPQPSGPDADSTVVRFTTDATVFENYEKTSNGFEWTPSSASWNARQQCLFETSHDATANTRNQFYNLSGSVIRNGVLPHDGGMGLEWTPITYVNQRQSGSAFNTTADVGPVMQWTIRDIPLRVRGGMSGGGWNDSLPANILESRCDALDSDVGGYGACSVGDQGLRLLGRPLYVAAEAFGRSIRQAGLAAVMGAALYAGRVGDGDSLFAYYGDSLSNGKEIPWGVGGGPQHFANTPWRIARSFRTMEALKMKERFGFLPAFIYSYTQNSVEYPTLRTMLSNVKVYAHSLTMQVGTRDGLPVIYKGGIVFSWGAEEWLFRDDLTTASLSYHKSASQLDSLSTKLQDHRNYSATTDHRVTIFLPRGYSAAYTLSALRESKTYTFSFIHNDREFGNLDDNDRITVLHHVGVSTETLDWLHAEIYGEYSGYLLNFLQSERSAQNFSKQRYQIGLLCSYKPSDRFSIDERIYTDAEISDYFYKKTHQDPFDPPPYQRRVMSMCSGFWKINDTWFLNGKWNESYDDKGFWYGKAYRPPGADTLKSDYYAIQNKRTDYSIELSLGMAKKRLRMESGCLFREIFNRRFNGQQYVIDNIGVGNGYLVEPFTDIRLTYRGVSLRGRIIRMINTAAKDKWEFKKNWDIRLMGQAAW